MIEFFYPNCLVIIFCLFLKWLIFNFNFDLLYFWVKFNWTVIGERQSFLSSRFNKLFAIMIFCLQDLLSRFIFFCKFWSWKSVFIQLFLLRNIDWNLMIQEVTIPNFLLGLILIQLLGVFLHSYIYWRQAFNLSINFLLSCLVFSNIENFEFYVCFGDILCKFSIFLFNSRLLLRKWQKNRRHVTWFWSWLFLLFWVIRFWSYFILLSCLIYI